MRVLMLVAGWFLVAAGFLISIVAVVDGLRHPENAVTFQAVTPVMVAGAVLVLAGVLSPRTKPGPQQPGPFQPPQQFAAQPPYPQPQQPQQPQPPQAQQPQAQQAQQPLQAQPQPPTGQAQRGGPYGPGH